MMDQKNLLVAIVLSVAILFGFQYAFEKFLPHAPPAKTTLNAFALSPDGRKLVFNARGGDGRGHLWLRLMDTLEARELPGTEGANLDPTWSPDSQFIAFMAEGYVKKIDISGGSPQILAPYTNPATGISWGPKDVILFGSLGLIHRVPAAGGDAIAVTATDLQRSEQGQGRPFMLPDGKHFFYFRLMADQTGIYVGSLDAKPAEQDKKRFLDSKAGVEYVDVPNAKSGSLFFLRGDSLMEQPFNVSRMEFTGGAVQMADRVSNNLYNGLFSVSNNGLARASFLGRSEVRSSVAGLGGVILGGVIVLDMELEQLSLMHQVMLHNRPERKRGKERQSAHDDNGADQQPDE